MIKLTAENYPISEYYKTDELLTSLGIGEAAVAALDEKGRPTALAATLLCAPKSRMDILTTEEIESVISRSTILKKYSEAIDRESAYELLNAKLASASDFDTQNKIPASTRQPKSAVEKMIDSPLARQVGRTVARELTRGILGVLGLGGTTRKRKSLF